MKYDKRLMQNHLLVSTFLKNHPGADPSSFHPDMEYREQEDYLYIKQPEQMITAAQLQKGQLFGFSSYMSPFDITERVQECIYCGTVFKPERSTAKYCCPSHRVLEFRRRKRKARLAERNAEPNTTSVTRDLFDDSSRQRLYQKAVVRNAVMHKTSKQLFIVFLSIHSSIKRIFYGGINEAGGDKALMTGNETTICLTLACSPHIITNFSRTGFRPRSQFCSFSRSAHAYFCRP